MSTLCLSLAEFAVLSHPEADEQNLQYSTQAPSEESRGKKVKRSWKEVKEVSGGREERNKGVREGNGRRKVKKNGV